MEKTFENPQQIGAQDNKSDKNKATSAYTQQQLEANTQIKGFLAIYLLTAIIGVAYSLFLGLKAYNILGEDLSSNIAIANIFTIFTLCYTGVYTIYAFIRRKANATFYAKAYAGLMIFANILILITSLTKGHLTADCLLYLGGLCLGIIWMGYLFVSTKAKEVVPSACRNAPQVNRAVIIGLFTTSVVLFLLGTPDLVMNFTTKAKQKKEMLSRKLQPNQRTNGVFIFTIPKGFTCERQQFKEKLPIDPLFEIHNKYVGSAGLTAFYLSDEYTEKVYRSWEKEILKNFDDVSPQLIAEGQENINGNTCTYRIRKIEKKGETVFWRYCILIDKKKEKACIISAFDNGVSVGYITELIKSIKFE